MYKLPVSINSAGQVRSIDTEFVVKQKVSWTKCNSQEARKKN